MLDTLLSILCWLAGALAVLAAIAAALAPQIDAITLRPWHPPDGWSEDDGCSGVMDLHYKWACRRHDWRYRRAGARPRWLWPLVKLCADLHLFIDMQRCNRREGVGRNHFWWWVGFPVWRTLAVMIWAWGPFRPDGDG
jgi:hypothetical protein